MKSGLLILSFIFLGCGVETPFMPEYLPNRDIDKYFSAFISEFINEADKRRVSINMRELRIVKFDPELDKNRLGLCERFYYKKNKLRFSKITINPITKEKDELIQKYTMLHELGHCVLRLDHDPKDSFSIMRPFAFSNMEIPNILENEEKLIDDMFNKTPTFKLTDRVGSMCDGYHSNQ